MKTLRCILASVFLLTMTAHAEQPLDCKPAQVSNSYELGLSLLSILPSGLPQFDVGLPAYGPSFSVPLGDRFAIGFRATYGGFQTLSMYLLEPSLRLNINTPFFDAYALAGGQYLHYSNSGTAHAQFGAHLGSGFQFGMGSSNKWNLGMRVYLVSKPFMAVEGGFAFLL